MSQRTPSPRKQATQEALIEAAYGLFSQKGFAGTTTREIAEAAGVNELTLFRHFQNKNNLLEAVISQYSNFQRLEQILSVLDEKPFDAGMHYFARVMLAILEEKYPMIRLMILEATTNPELKTIVGPIPVKMRQMLVQLLKKGVAENKVRTDLDLELVAQSFLWIFLSYVLTRSDVGEKFCPFPPEDVAQASTDIFLKGIHP